MWLADIINKVFRSKVEEDELEQWEYSESVPIKYMEELMPVKEMFLRYVELQNGAESDLQAFGPDDKRTKESFDKANVYKRKVLDMLEEIEK